MMLPAGQSPQLRDRGLKPQQLQLDSQLKCDTEVCGERFDRGAVAEALARR
jgi:hypothetical protein